MGFIHSLITIKTVYLIVFLVAVFMLIQHFVNQFEDAPQPRQSQVEAEDTNIATSEGESSNNYQPGDKED